MRVSLEPDAEGPKHQVKEYGLGPTDTGAMGSRGEKTRFYTSPILGLNGSCNGEQDKGPSPRKLRLLGEKG